jgi:tetratricopeptide (TPR) repeat protein
MSAISVARPTPASIGAIFRRGILSFERENWSDALTCFDAVVRLSPHRNDVHNYRARAYERLGRLDDALECLDRALAINPENLADLRNRAVLLEKLGRSAESLSAFEAVLATEPNDVLALTKRGLLLNGMERREEALASIERAVRVQPDRLDALNAQVIVLDNLSRYSEALEVLDRMLELAPDYVDTINNLGMIHARLGRFEEALRYYDRSLQLDPSQAQAHYNRSLVRLSLGDWTRGLEEFESRWQTEALKRSRWNGLAPLWLGREDLRGKTILLYHEQGYGDTLMCARYVPLLSERGARVVLAVPEALREIMLTVPGISQVVSGDAAGGLVHHYHAPMMGLLRAFRTTPDSVPGPVPYLSAVPAQTSSWGQRLGPKTKLRVGLVWSGRRYAPINYPRDLPLERLLPLLDLNVEFISLQKEMTDSDRELLMNLPGFRSCGESLESFADTAALIENLDLVLTADTAVAHLAGALGKRVWLMNRYAACWRWTQRGAESAWYPTLRQFRQPSIGDWNSVVADVRTALLDLTTPKSDIAAWRLPPAKAEEVTNLNTPAVTPAAREKIRFVCATRLSIQAFFAKAALGRSLPAYRYYPPNQAIEVRLFPENRAGLPQVYNTAIEEALNNPAILVFIHDDVFLSDYFWSDHLHKALTTFDIVGLVGNRRRIPRQASWMYLNDRFVSDTYDNFSGVVGHGEPFPNLRQLSVYGPPGLEVKLLDGVLIAARSTLLHERDLRFDPRFLFHFYDMDFCRQAELRQLRMGTCAMSLVHESAGILGNEGWRTAYESYLAKYGESQPLETSASGG